MGIVCASCDELPPADAKAGAACASCGERLIAVEAAPADDLIGKNLDGRFHIKARLGNGAMGVVYRAIQLSINREVALKVLDRRIERDVAAVKRFFREAKVASTLAHPNTVPIIDFGQHQDGRLYLVMELVHGRTLLDEINLRGALPLARVVTIGVQLCDALEVAHGLAIVHRDLKPENVMLVEGSRDHVKVLDFGLARSLSDPGITATGSISGTPRYMPPELAFEAAPAAPSHDMYAVGVMLAELALGKALWTAPTIEAMFAQKLDGGLSALVELPSALRPLVTALLDLNPQARPGAAATRAALQAIPTGLPTAASLPRAAAPIGMPEISSKDLVSLEQVTGLPAPAPPVGAPADSAFVPPAAEVAEASLELDPVWTQQRADKQRAAAVPVRPRRSGAAAGVVVAVLLIGLAATGVYVLSRSKPESPRLPGGGISIRIKAAGYREVSIDGRRVGTTPLTLQLPKATQPILVTSPGLEPHQVVPDHDQVIDLSVP
jgi:serine/threonine-protein kinase